MNTIRCIVCILNSTSPRYAYTIINGSALCQSHITTRIEAINKLMIEYREKK